MISELESARRKRLDKVNDWRIMCETLLRNIYKLKDCYSLQKGGRYVCFSVVHEKDYVACSYCCTCQYPVEDPPIKVYFLSELFETMVNASHSQILFDGASFPDDLNELFHNFRVSLEPIELFEFEEAVDHTFADLERAESDDRDFQKEQTLEFQLMRDEFESLLLKYIRLAFTDPESLPPFLLDHGPTMLLSELDAWLKSE